MKTLIDGYSYLFFRLWRWHRKYFGESDLPHLNATLNLGLLLILNWIAFALLTRWATGVGITSWSTTEAVMTIVIVGLIQYGIFFHRGRHKRIIKRFWEEKADVSRTVNFISYAYPVITFVGLMAAGILSWGIDRR